jgi:hypothetical protein
MLALSSLEPVGLTVFLAAGMMACQHFLAGRCNRSDADCKWSHGAVARLAELMPWQVRTFCAVPRTVLSLSSVGRLLYRPPIFHQYWGSGSGSTCFDGPPESRSISQIYGSGSVSQEVRIRIRTKMGILNTGFHSLFTENFFRLYCSEQPAIQCSGYGRHRFDADLDQHPTFHFDAYPDLDPDPTPSFTHTGIGKSEIFLTFILSTVHGFIFLR